MGRNAPSQVGGSGPVFRKGVTIEGMNSFCSSTKNNHQSQERSGERPIAEWGRKACRQGQLS